MENSTIPIYARLAGAWVILTFLILLLLTINSLS